MRLESAGTFPLIPKVILHLSTYKIPDSDYITINEKDTINNSIDFYMKFNAHASISPVFENVYPPGIGWEELGYRLEHFSMFELPKNSEFCFDTGHFNISTMKWNDILKIPLKLTCMHIHSNNGKKDEHIPLTAHNFREFSKLSALITDELLLVLEIKNDIDLINEGLQFVKECIKMNKK